MRATRFRLFILTLSFLLGVLNYLDRASIAFFAKPIMAAFHLDHAGFGAIASAFGVGYMVFAFVGGWLADAFGPRRLFGITGLIWGVSTSAVGLVSGFGGLFVARAVLGAAEGPVYPGLIKAFNDWMPARERTTAVAYAIPASVGTAVILGGPIASLVLTLSDSWKTMFFGLGVASIVMAGVWYLVFRDDPADCRQVNAAELEMIRTGAHATGHGSFGAGRGLVSVGEMFRDPTLLCVYFGFFAVGYFFWFMLTWLPSFLEESYKVSLASSALFSVLPWIAYIIGSLGSGYVSDYFTRRSGSFQVKAHLIWFSLIGTALALIPVIALHSLGVALGGFTLALGVAGVCVPPLWALNSDVLPQRPGLSSGFMDAAFALSGILAPMISGIMVQSFGGYNAAIIMAGGIAGLGALLIMIFARPDRSAQKFRALETARKARTDMAEGGHRLQA